MDKRKQAFRHDFSGNCGPDSEYYESQMTFLVGVFQWIPKSHKTGLRKSKVKYRIRGRASQPNKVYERAKEVCKIFDEGWKLEGYWFNLRKKSETVK